MAKQFSRMWAHEGEPMTKFPPEVLAMKDLEVLSLYGCFEWKTIKIPPQIAKLKRLKTLAIGMAKVESLPDAVGRLTNLVDLDLNYAEELRSLPSNLGALKNLEKLQLSYTPKLKALPASIGKLRKLDVLWASPSGLTSVPPTLWNVTSLRELTLPESVNKLPPGISKLTKLEVLHLSPSALMSIADELPALRSLKTLNVGFVNATKLPETLGSLANLRDLCLYYMKELTELPASLANLKKLTKLDVSGNALKQLVSLVVQLPKLKDLEYSENKLPLAERRLIEKLMRMPPNKRKLDGVTPVPAAARPKPVSLGSVASINSYLAVLLVDGKLAPAWDGVGDDPDSDSSDWDRFRRAVARKQAAPLTVGDGKGVAVDISIGQGLARVYRVGSQIALVEGFIENDKDPIFLEYVSGAPQGKRASTLDVPSKALVITPSTDGCSDVASKLAKLDTRAITCGTNKSSLLVPVDAKRYDVFLEDEVERSWGSGRRALLVPA